MEQSKFSVSFDNTHLLFKARKPLETTFVQQAISPLHTLQRFCMTTFLKTAANGIQNNEVE